MCLMKSRGGGKDCKGVVAQKDKSGWNLSLHLTCSFVFYSFRNWEPVELLEERCAVLMV